MLLFLFKNSFYFDKSMINTILKINSFRRLIIILFLLIPIRIAYSAPEPVDVPQEIIDALKTGNTAALSGFFNTSIELAIPGKEDIYSKQQAELIIKEFFSKHVPTSFAIVHKGGKEGAQYIIGNLITSDGKYRVTLLIKQDKDRTFIHQLRFDEENAE